MLGAISATGYRISRLVAVIAGLLMRLFHKHRRLVLLAPGWCCALGLWFVGALTTPDPRFVCLLIGLAMLWGGFASLLAARRAWRAARPHLVALGFGLVSAMTPSIFILMIFIDHAEPLRIEGPAPVPGRAPEHIRLVNWNVLHGFPGFVEQERRTQQIITAIAALDPDIVVLQESWDTTAYGNLAQRLAEALDTHAFYARANGSRRLIGFEEGSAILSRFPIRSAERHVLRPSRAFWERRIALRVEIAISADENWTLIGTHLSTARRAGDDQARHLATLIPEQDFCVLTGDLNAPSASPRLRNLTAAGLRDLIPGGIDHVLTRPGSARWHTQRADWALRPQDVAEFTGETLRLSNHPALVVDFVRVGPPMRHTQQSFIDC